MAFVSQVLLIVWLVITGIAAYINFLSLSEPSRRQKIAAAFIIIAAVLSFCQGSWNIYRANGLKNELAALKANDALYLNGNLAAQTIAPEIDKKSSVIKFNRVVEATSKLDWNATFTYRGWRLRCNGPSEPDYNLWSYGVIRSYGYNDIECRITP
jgi:hypothetical protein